MEINEGNSDTLKSIEFIRNKRDELIDNYIELLNINDNNYHEIIKYRERIDKLNKQIRTLEDCLIIVRVINSEHFEEF